MISIHCRQLRDVQRVAICMLTLIVWFSSDAVHAESLYSKLLPTTANVEVGGSRGTAWVYDTKNRLLLTNYHVVADGEHPKTKTGYFRVHEEVKVCFPRRAADGTRLVQPVDYERRYVKARVIDADSTLDLALIQASSLPPTCVAAKLAAKLPEPGETVHTVGGRPSGSTFMWPYASGLVRQTGRKIWRSTGGASFYSAGVVVETQTPINPGNSGGAIFNDAGEVVAVNQSTHRASVLTSTHVGLPMIRAFLAKALPFANPKSAEDFARRASHYLEVNRYAAAESDFEQALKLGPADVNRTKLGMVKSLVQLRPTESFLYDDRWEQRCERARKICDEVIQTDPKNADAFALRFQARISGGLILGATTGDLKKALELDPGCLRAHKIFAGIEADTVIGGLLGDHKAARKKRLHHLTFLVERSKGDFRMLLYRARVYAEYDQIDLALKDCTKAIAIIRVKMLLHWPEVVHLPPALRQAVSYEIEENHYRGLEKLTVQLVQIEPELPENHYLHGRALLGQDKHVLATKFLTQAIELQLKTYDKLLHTARHMFVHRGDAFAALKNWDRAKSDYQVALQIKELLGKSDPEYISDEAIKRKIGRLPKR